MRFWTKLKIMKIFLQLVRDPNRTDLIFEGVDTVTEGPELPPIRAVREIAMSHAEFRRMYEEGYVPQPPHLEDLGALPEGTFGRAVHAHMTKNGLDFSLWPKIAWTSPAGYMSTRLYQDHDLWHALLGYGVEIEDELAIQALAVAQFRSPVGTLIIVGGLLHLLLKEPMRAVAAIGKIHEGYARGERAKFLLEIKLHEHFVKPLEVVRQECGLEGPARPQLVAHDKFVARMSSTP